MALTSKRVFIATAPWSYASLAGRGEPELGDSVKRDVSGQGVLPTLGMHYLAAALESGGADVKVVEGYGISRAHMLQQIASFKPHVVGLSLQTPLWPEARRLVTELRKQDPDVRIALGGAHVNLRGTQLFEEAPEVDAAFSGPAEDSFSNWVSNLNGRTDPQLLEPEINGRSLSETPGFATRVAARVPWHTYIPNLMFLGHERFATSVSTMGCGSACSFCGLTRNFKGRFARPHESLLEELSFLAKARGIKTVNFMDDNTAFAHPTDEADELLDRLAAQNLDLEWTIYLNNFDITDDRLRRMKAAGCRRVLMLTESGSQKIANLAHGKDIPIDKIANAIERVHRAGIEVGARFQIGFPSETWQDGLESIKFALGLPLTLASFVKTLILPGSRVGRKAVAAGRAPAADEHWSYYGRPVPPDAMTLQEQSRLVKMGISAFYGRQLLNGRLLKLPRPFHIMRRVVIDGTE